MSELLPGMGASGHWRLKAPFDNALVPGLAYICQAQQSVGMMLATGMNVYEEIYDKWKIEIEVYDKHVADNITICTLISSSGNFVFVPAVYIDGWPSNDSIPYVVLGLFATLGAIPNTLDPSFLIDKVKNLIKSSIGLAADIEFVAMSEVENIAWVDHQAMEVARKTLITDDNSDYAKRVKAEADLNAARVQIQALQKFIVDSGIPVPGQ